MDFQKQPSLLLSGEVLWQASDSPLSKELHERTIQTLLINNTIHIQAWDIQVEFAARKKVSIFCSGRSFLCWGHQHQKIFPREKVAHKLDGREKDSTEEEEEEKIVY